MKIRWILIGCGKVVLKNNNTVFSNENNEIVGIKTTNKESELNAIKKLGLNIIQYDSLDNMLENINYDAIYICTPPKYHYEYLNKLTAINKPIVVEKPFLLNYKQCLDIYNKFPNKNVYPLLYKGSSEKIKYIKDLVINKKYGKIIKIEGVFKRIFNTEHLNSWIYNKSISGGGRVFDIIEHILEVLYSIFGNFSEINSYTIYDSKYHDCETKVNSKLYCGGILTTLYFDMESEEYKDEIVLYSNKHKIVFSINGNNSIYIYNNNNNLIKKIDIPPEKYWGIETINNIRKLIVNENINYLPNIEDMLIIEKCVENIIK